MAISFEAISQFFRKRATAVRRILGATRGEVELPELQSEAWIAAEAIGRKRGYPFDFNDLADQETLLGRLYNHLVRFADKTVKFAIKLDTDWDKDESKSAGATLARLLAAPESSDPLLSLTQTEDGDEVLAALQLSYSQATAYVLLLRRFHWQAQDLAEHLKLAIDSLRRRFRMAAFTVQCQPSLFDGLARLDPDFVASPRRPISTPHKTYLDGRQVAWSF